VSSYDKRNQIMSSVRWNDSPDDVPRESLGLLSTAPSTHHLALSSIFLSLPSEIQNVSVSRLARSEEQNANVSRALKAPEGHWHRAIVLSGATLAVLITASRTFIPLFMNYSA